MPSTQPMGDVLMVVVSMGCPSPKVREKKLMSGGHVCFAGFEKSVSQYALVDIGGYGLGGVAVQCHS
ncbi:hypothetical protein FACS189456_3180 [Bacteroidia bacterium]|nr:hypothetical protein FACS189456_3180 [Bacteroidia bacterium]